MHPALVPLLGLSRQSGFTLAAAGILNAPASLSRAQVTSTATALGMDGVAWQGFAANAPRFAGTARRLLIEGQRTNGLRNPRGQGSPTATYAPGAGAGLGSTLAIHWWLPNRLANLAIDVSPVSDFGMSGVRLRYYGTTSTTPGNETLEFEWRNVFPATSAAAVTGSFFYRLVAGSLPAGMQPTARIITVQADGGTPVTVNPSAPLPMDGTLRRAVHTVTPGANSAFASVGFHMQAWTANTACDFTVDLFWPQIELGAFASTPILPPVNAPAASTRGGDIFGASLAALGIAPNGASTTLWTARHTVPATQASWQALFEIGDGTSANRIGVVRPANLEVARFQRAAGNVQAFVDVPITSTNMNRYGLSIDGAGRIALSVNGVAPVVLSGAPTSGLSTFRLGSEAFNPGQAPLFGEMGVARAFPFALPDAALSAQVAALP